MFEIGDFVEITEQSAATGMLDFVVGRGYEVISCTGKNSDFLLLEDEGRKGDWYSAQHFKRKEDMKTEEGQEVKTPLFKVGQVVYDTSFGRGVVSFATVVQAQVKFDSTHGTSVWFTQDGVYHLQVGARNRTLFFSPPEIVAETEPVFESKLAKGTPVVLTLCGLASQMICGWVQEESKDSITLMTSKEASITYEKSKWLVYSIGQQVTFD